ncbi:MAG: ATP-dependent Clp protease ATP-binding subunit, partial [Paludibacteraceae bacterium]|nr:ATP-dependent Clp protease ATP-binding subunit [Paludibacteraceae bacterium]
IDFKNAIIIMTSNVGSRQLKDFGRGIGFYDESDGGNSAHQDAVIRKALNKTFSPEFLNRVDEIITFESLSRESIHRIIDIELKGLFERIRQMGYEIQISQEAKDYIADQGYDPQYGARPLRRAIQHHVEDKISDLLLESERPAPDSHFHIDLLDGAISISIKS